MAGCAWRSCVVVMACVWMVVGEQARTRNTREANDYARWEISRLCGWCISNPKRDRAPTRLSPPAGTLFAYFHMLTPADFVALLCFARWPEAVVCSMCNTDNLSQEKFLPLAAVGITVSVLRRSEMCNVLAQALFCAYFAVCKVSSMSRVLACRWKLLTARGNNEAHATQVCFTS